MPPVHPYLVCATQRSGSTLLCESLRTLGVAGHPEEFFQSFGGTGKPRTLRNYVSDLDDPELAAILGERSPVDDEPTQVEAAGCASFARYVEHVRRQAATPNGAFGFKLMWAYLGDLAAGLRAYQGAPGLDDRELLERTFGPLRYVHAYRRDHVRQAVSLWRALQTWSWRAEPSDGEERGEPRYHGAAIEQLVQLLRAEDRAWRTWFDAHGIAPIAVVYEDLVDDFRGTMRATLAALELPVPAHLGELAPPLHRQADARSEDWVERYRTAYADDDERLAGLLTH